MLHPYKRYSLPQIIPPSAWFFDTTCLFPHSDRKQPCGPAGNYHPGASFDN